MSTTVHAIPTDMVMVEEVSFKSGSVQVCSSLPEAKTDRRAIDEVGDRDSMKDFMQESDLKSFAGAALTRSDTEFSENINLSSDGEISEGDTGRASIPNHEALQKKQPKNEKVTGNSGLQPINSALRI